MFRHPWHSFSYQVRPEIESTTLNTQEVYPHLTCPKPQFGGCRRSTTSSTLRRATTVTWQVCISRVRTLGPALYRRSRSSFQRTARVSGEVLKKDSTDGQRMGIRLVVHTGSHAMVVMVVIASLPYIAAPPPAHENAAKPTCFGVANARQEP